MKNGTKHKRKPAPVPERAKPNVSLSRRLWPLLLLPVAGVVAYWNSFDVPFVFDDFVTIQSNSSVQFGDLLSLPANLWTRTLLYMTFAANYAAGGQNVWGYHLVNLLLQQAVDAKDRELILRIGRDGSPDGVRKALQLILHCPEYQLA